MFQSFALVVGKQIEANLKQKQAAKARDVVAVNINTLQSAQRARKHLTGKVITEPINPNTYYSTQDVGHPGDPVQLGEYDQRTESTRSVGKDAGVYRAE
jgi:hypothetical protein